MLLMSLRGQSYLRNVRIRQVERGGNTRRLLAERGPPESPQQRRLTIPPYPADPETANNARERIPGKPRPSKAAPEPTVSRSILQQHPVFA